ncbi:MAG: hypothetical protein E7302_08715 [Butyrivibrio sp.]|nr:hypothetical protein [Butyrivibrio sp.]
MKTIKQLSKKLATLALAFTLLLGTTSVTAYAATTNGDNITVRTYKNGYYYTGTEYGAPITVNFDAVGDRIANLKSSSVDLRVYTVSIKKGDKTGKIGVWSKKPGKYTVDFDVVDAAGAVKEHKTVNVKVVIGRYIESAVKDIKYNGKSLWLNPAYDAVNMPKSGKVNVVMNKNFKLTGLRIGKRNANNEYVYSKVKNGKKITLDKKAYTYSSSGSSYSYYTKNMESNTQLEITYKNKKTGETGVVTYSISRLVNYNK